MNLIMQFEKYLKHGIEKHLYDTGDCKSHSYSHLLGGINSSESSNQYCVECSNETLIAENIKLAIKDMQFQTHCADGRIVYTNEPGIGDNHYN